MNAIAVRLGGLALVALACSPGPPPVAPSSTPPATETIETASPEPAPAPAPPTSEPEPEPARITGIEACDRYLVAYQKCESKLKPEIQAGDRRTYEAEKNWLVFMKDRPEGKELPATCATLQAELDKSCT